MNFNIKKLFVIIVLLSLNAYAAKRPQGGTFNTELDGEPSTLSPYTSTDLYSQQVQSFILESLLTRDIETYKWKGMLADKWEISKDKKVFTFKIRDNAKFSDGKPVTAEDVKFSLDSIRDDRYKSVIQKPFYEGLDRVEIVDAHTVKFYTKDNRYKNFDMAAGLSILPKHVYGNPEDKFSRLVVGSGAYKIENYEKGKRIILVRNPFYWDIKRNQEDGENNFDKIILKFLEQPEIQFETFKKKELDYMTLTPEQYVQKTKGPGWGKEFIKVRASNKVPKGYNYIGLNQKSAILSSKQVRLALAQLVNRKLMINKFRFGLAENTNGPIPNGTDSTPDIPSIPFDPKKALKNLEEDGWKDSDKDGVLDKTINGKKTDLKITILMATNQWEKYLTVIKEEAKKVGFEIDIKNIEWNAFLKIMDEGNFDAFIMGWGGGSQDMDEGLRQIFHSSAAIKGGSNRINYSNKKVDELLEKCAFEWDRPKRIKMIKEAATLIANDLPYVFLFNATYTHYAHLDRVKKVKDTYKYGIGTSFWWLKQE